MSRAVAEFRISKADALKRRRTRAAVLAAILVTVSACGGTDEPLNAEPEPVPSSTSASSSPAADDAAAAEPIFVPTADGGQLDFNSLRGTDVLLWFWAPW